MTDYENNMHLLKQDSLGVPWSNENPRIKQPIFCTKNGLKPRRGLKRLRVQKPRALPC